MQYAPYVEQADGSSINLEPSIFWTLVYDRAFTYENMPTRTYRILGKPTISLTFNFTTFTSVTLIVMYNVTLWKIQPNSSTELLCTFSNPVDGMVGTLTDYQLGKSFCTQDWINMTITENQRLMLRVQLYAQLASTPAAWLLPELIYRKNTDDFRLDIPMVTDP
jgi:hypothetical protein